MVAALSYAFLLGLAAAVNPCGFPMLPAYLSVFVRGDQETPSLGRRLANAARSAAAVSAGFAVLFAVLGGIFEAGVSVFMAWVPWAMVVFGAALAAAGVWTLAGHHIRLPLPRLSAGTGRGAGVSMRSMVVFGMSYAMASLTCTLPIFLAGVATTFTRVGWATGIGTFLAFAAGMAVVLAVVALALALARTSVLGLMRRAGRHLGTASSAVLVAVGLYLVYYWLVYLYSPHTPGGLITGVDRVESSLTTLLGSGSTVTVLGIALAVALVGAAAWVAVGRGRPLRRPGSPVSDSGR